jgi:cell division protein FtsZ
MVYKKTYVEDTMIEFEKETFAHDQIAKIKVVGIGGAGGNTVNSIMDAGCSNIEFIVINTDAQALDLSRADKKIQIGVKSTKGLGTGTNPELGARAAQEDLDKVLEAIADADIVFLAGGMGGGTGSGALPVIAKALHEKNILTIAIITKPFLFEGKRRERVAQEAIAKVKDVVDTLIIVPNQKLLEIAGENVSMIEAFGKVNDLLSQSVRGISDIITQPGHINVDFADVRTIMKNKGIAIMGTGKASGQDRAEMAAMEATASPLLENIGVKGAQSVLMNITGGKNLGLHEISKAAQIIYKEAHEDANIIIGSVIDESMSDEIMITIIATGFGQEQQIQEAAPAAVEPIKPEPIKAAVKEVATPPFNPGTPPYKKPETEWQPVIQHAVSPKEVDLIDLNDLDTPTFLRNNYEQNDQQ